MLCRSRTRPNPELGASLIEFAFSIAVILFVVFWTWELVMAVYTYSVLSDAAKEGVRYAIVHGSDVGAANCSGPKCTDATGANVAATVSEYARYSLHDISSMSVSVAFYDPDVPSVATSADPGILVVVSVSYNYIPWIDLPWRPPTLKTGAQGRIVW